MVLETVRRSGCCLQTLWQTQHVKPHRFGGPAMALPTLVPHATDAMSAVEPHRPLGLIA